MTRFIVVGMSVVLLAAVATVAAEEEVITGLQKCQEIADVEERLACYDALAEEFRGDTGETAEEAGSEAAPPVSSDQSVAAEPGAPEDEPEDEKLSREPGSPTGQQSGPEPASPVGRRSDPEPESGVAPGEPEARGNASGASRAERVTSAEDLSLPHRTRIDSFASNRRGDYRFRIGEGIVFERAGGPGVPSADLTGARVTLSKNFLGQWRAEVEGQSRELWVSPVRR